jgi:RNA polymerase sigma-70 factor, ECF subfamily
MLAGEEAAFGELAERCFPALYRFALARLHGDRDLTREIVQAAVAKALGKLASYRGEASLLTWLCACCRNEILMHFRRMRSGPPELALDSGAEVVLAAPAAGGPEAVLLRQELAVLVHMALDGIPARYAQALEWKYVDGLPVETIAARLGLGSKAAESLLTRARQAFRTSYADVADPGTERN